MKPSAAAAKPAIQQPKRVGQPRTQSLAEWFRFWLKVSRPGLWSTAAWFYLLPTGRSGVLGSWQFWLGLFYVTFPLGFFLYGWNDLGDRETDRLNPRKGNYLFGARGTDEQLARLPLHIACTQAPFVALFLAQEGTRMLGWFAALALANTLYNTPPFRWKSRPPLDLVNQVGYLLVFVLGSWLDDLPQLPWATFVFGGLFAMHSHLFGQIMDILPDRQAGRRTTATLLGVRASKLLLILFLAAESALVTLLFQNVAIGAFLGLAALWFLLDVCVIWKDRLYTQAQIRLFALGLNVVALGSMPWMWASGSLTRLP